MYGYQDSEELAPGKSGGKFGLNSGAFVTKFEYNPNAGQGGAEGDAIDVTVQVGEREFRKRFFPVSKFYREGKDANGNKLEGEITDTNSDEYREAYAREMKRFNSSISSIVECFVTTEELKAALASPISSFKDFAEILQRLVQSNPNWSKTPVDVFLQYQWNIKGENNRTYLEFAPKNKTITMGAFICKSLGTGFKQVEGIEGIKYANKQGVTHPFKRNAWFVTSAFAKQAVLDEGGNDSANPMANSPAVGANWGV